MSATKRFLTFATALGLSLFLLNSLPIENADEKDSDALEALNFWAVSRAYPEKKFPSRKYAEEFARVKQLKSVNDEQPWEAIGPKNFGGRTISVAVNPQNPNTIFAGSASGGLWKSLTAGEGANAWEYVNTGLPVLGVSSIAVSPVDTNVMFIGTGEVYAYQNSTGGIVDRLTRGSYGIGILKTTDGGITWSKSLDWSMNQERGVWVVKFNPQNSNTIFAGTTEGLFISYDNGDTWRQKSSVAMVTDLIINPNDTNKVLMACGNFGSPHYGIYRSTNAGNNWTKITNGLPTEYSGKVLFSFYKKNPQIVYASIGGGLSGTWLCKSNDFGESWQIVSTDDYATYQGWYSHIVIVNSEDSSKILAAGVEIYKSTNGGVTLNQKSYWWKWYFGRTIAGGEEGPPDYSHADNHCFAYDPENPNVIYFGTDGGIFKTTDFGETFHGRNGGYQTQQFYNGFSSVYNDGYFAIGGLQDNASAIYDGQTNWIRTLHADGSWTAINYLNPSIVYGSYYYLNIYRSTNGGNDWTKLSLYSQEDAAFISPFTLSPANPSIVYAASNKLFKSTDGGNSWTTKYPSTNNPAISIACSFYNPDLLYIGFAPENGTLNILKSEDGGNSFTDISAGLPNRYPMDIAVDANDDNNVIIVFSGFGSSHVFYSTDGGSFWQDITGDLPDVPTNAVAIDDLNPGCFYVGNDIGVFFTSNYGESWRRVSNGMPDASIVMDLSIPQNSRKIIAATHGNGAYVTDLLQPDDVRDETNQPQNFVLFQNYPNPFNPTTNITYVIPSVIANPDEIGVKQSIKNSASANNSRDCHVNSNKLEFTRNDRVVHVSLKIYDALGREVATLVNMNQTPGKYSVQFNANNLPSGIYFYTLRAGAFVQTKKMVLMK